MLCLRPLSSAVATRVRGHRISRRTSSLWSSRAAGRKPPVLPQSPVEQVCPVPDHVAAPDYYLQQFASTDPRRGPSAGCAAAAGVGGGAPPTEPEVKDAPLVDRMRRACRLARSVLDAAGELASTVGATTAQVDALVRRRCFAAGAFPSPLSYRGFPAAVCTSVNNVACHGIPDERPLEAGDIINVDVTVFLDGVHGDCSETFIVGGELQQEDQQQVSSLLSATGSCLSAAVAECGPGVPFSRVGEVVQRIAEDEHGFSVLGAFAGHGIGRYFHGPPDIYHVRNRYPGVMRPGMTFTVEPILCEGSPKFAILEDGWTALTLDHGWSAQFEHTVLITDDGREVLTEKEAAETR